MKKNLTELVFILDRSGSMSGLESDTIGGFNAMIDQQKKAEGEAIVSTVLFSSQSTVIGSRFEWNNIKSATLSPSAATAIPSRPSPAASPRPTKAFRRTFRIRPQPSSMNA